MICLCSHFMRPAVLHEVDREPVEQFRVHGRSPSAPKLHGVFTSPRPKCHAHTRFTITRAVSGLSFDAMAFARSSRVKSLPGGGR